MEKSITEIKRQMEEWEKTDRKRVWVTVRLIRTRRTRRGIKVKGKEYYEKRKDGKSQTEKGRALARVT